MMNLLKLVAALALVFVAIHRPEAAELRPGWNAEWEKTLEAAKKEGRVVLYASEGREIVFREFQKKYPEIKVVTVLGRGNQIAQRVMGERRAGKHLADIYISGSGTAYDFYDWKALDPVKPALILPEVLDESKWWGGKHVYHDDESRYILAFNGVVQSYFSRNTKAVDPKEFSTYRDFLNPKWKGKIVSYDPSMGGAVSGVLMFFYRSPGLGPDFIRRFLSEMDLVPSRDSRQIVDWLSVGKYPIAAMIPPDRAGIYEAKRQGLPVDILDTSIFKEGAPLSTASGNLAIFNQAPNPNATKIAVNWLLSREGQIAYQTYDPEKDSLREDIPKDMVPEHVRRKKGANYLLLAGPGFKDMTPVDDLVKEAWRRR
jgi:iron(III) transport system substrate-binding protein